jgi:N-hydroxyarylamine O-acetyltransferase
MLDLPAYFDRIRWRGPTRRSYETLAGVLDAHMSAIPFENIDVLLGRGIRLDLANLQAKLVGARRGGYCFEHCTLLAAVLESLGFDVTRHTARVIVAAPRAEAGRTHMILTVRVGEDIFIVDPGFGALAPRAPLPLAEGVEVRVGHDTHWLERDGKEWRMRARTPEKVADGWVCALDDDNPIDFEMGNHFTSTYPTSPFLNRLMLRALTPDGRIGVMNRDVSTWRDGRAYPSQLADRSALRTLLATHFGFDLPEIEQLRVPSVPEWALP